MKTIYITRMSQDWNGDYIGAFESLQGVVNELFARAKEEDYFPLTEKKEIIEIMKNRCENGYVELLCIEDDSELERFQELTEFSIQAIALEK